MSQEHFNFGQSRRPHHPQGTDEDTRGISLTSWINDTRVEQLFVIDASNEISRLAASVKDIPEYFSLTKNMLKFFRNIELSLYLCCL